MRISLCLLLLFVACQVTSKPRVVLVTIDGLRWQEVFNGADNLLIRDKRFVKQPEVLKEQFWHQVTKIRREKLMPFFWQTIVANGGVIGNRDIGSNMSVTNGWHFSYPGYSEILTGVTDERINSNSKIANPNISFLEYLNKKPGYGGNLAMFAGWDVFPAILNVKRSGLYVNAGFMPVQEPLSEQTRLLNKLQAEIPSPWHNVRLDAFTYRYAKEYLLSHKPRVLAIAFGETDDFAHDGHYDQYLRSAHRTDAFLNDLWGTIQSHPALKNQTTLVITTDHGRGSGARQWRHHASKRSIKGYMQSLSDFPDGIIGSEHIWFAAIGPSIGAHGQIKTVTEIKQNQIAATVLDMLGEKPHQFNPKAGNSFLEILRK